MNYFVVSILLAVTSYIFPCAFAHEDHEGFCAAVLPTYPRDDGLDIGSFVLCECEESHATSGQTLVVCRYTHGSTTGSCDAKMCLFTQDCKMPTNFQPAQLDAKAFDYSVFDLWCVDMIATSTNVDDPKRTPTVSPKEETLQPTISPITPKPQDRGHTTAVRDENKPSVSTRIKYVLSLQFLVGATIIIGIF